MALIPRNRSSTKTATAYYTDKRKYAVNPYTGPWTEITYPFWSQSSWTDEQNGYKNPGWKSKVKAGADAGTPYSRSFCDVEMTGGSAHLAWQQQDGPYGMFYLWVQGTKNLVPPADVPFNGYIQADNQALVRFRKAIQEEYRQFQSLVFLGELGESVRMLRKPFAEMQRVIENHTERVVKRAVSIKAAQKRAILGRDRKGRPIYKRASLKELEQMVHSSWLEASFGMRPLLADTADIATTIARLSDSIRRSRVSGFGSSPGIASMQTLPVAYADLAGNLVIQEVSTWKVKYRAGIGNALNEPDSLSRLRQLAGFTPDQFVPTLWEICPWSFLADYFFNIGDCLSSYWTCTSYVQWANQSVVGVNQRTYNELVDHAAIRTAKGNTLRSLTGLNLPRTGKASRYQVTRTVLDPANLPQPMIDSKKFSDWNPMKVANIVALLRSKTKVASTLLTSSRG